MLTESWLKSNSGKDREKVEEIADRDSMSVRISKKGKITFQLRFRLNNKAARIDIGSYPSISLKDARIKSAEYKNIVERGVDPRIEEKLKIQNNQTQSMSLEELFKLWSEKYLFKSKKSATEILRTFELHVFPKIGNLPADRLTIQNWLNLLEPIAESKPSIASRIVNNSKQMYMWALRRELCTKNPLQLIDLKDDLHIEYVPKDRFLDDSEVNSIWKAMMRSRMYIRNRIFIQLLFIYGCRSGELRIAKKEHVKIDEGIWIIPAENHKNGVKTGKPLIRPLIKETIELFDRVAVLGDGEYLFTPSNKESPISRGALLSLPYDLTEYLFREDKAKIDHWSLHDIRRTMRTNMSKLCEPHIAEIMLGHALPKIWRTYDQHDYIEEQRVALERWVERLRLIVEPYPLL